MDVGKAAGWELAGASDVQKAELGAKKFSIAALVACGCLAAVVSTTACSQGEGAACQVTSDCDDGLSCVAVTKTCERPASGDTVVDAAPQATADATPPADAAAADAAKTADAAPSIDAADADAAPSADAALVDAAAEDPPK